MTAGKIWTTEEEDQLTDFWLSGKPAREAAAALGRTRNSVIGKAQRLGLSHPNPPNGAGVARKLSLPAPIPRRPEVMRAITSLVSASTTGVVLANLKPRHCRWPLWANTGPLPVAPRYCGSRKCAGSSYCDDHRAQSIRGPEDVGKFVPRKWGRAA